MGRFSGRPRAGPDQSRCDCCVAVVKLRRREGSYGRRGGRKGVGRRRGRERERGEGREGESFLLLPLRVIYFIYYPDLLRAVLSGTAGRC